MHNKEKALFIANILEKHYPNAKCNLHYHNSFQLLIAVILSAHTSDIAVNKVLDTLFLKYPNADALSLASEEELIKIIHSLGLYRNKAHNLIATAKILVNNYSSQVPNSLCDLTSLPGVGRKTANVIRAVWFNIPALAIDTHILRISNRLGLVNSGNTLIIEKKLTSLFPKNKWIKLHHQLIYFGREICLSKKPKCQKCEFKSFCNYYEQNKK